jgi:hypothetical protein
MTGLIPSMKRTPQTRLGAALRKLAKDVAATGRDAEAKQCEYAARNLDMAAISLGKRGAEVKQLGSYTEGEAVYRKVAGEPYVG